MSIGANGSVDLFWGELKKNIESAPFIPRLERPRKKGCSLSNCLHRSFIKHCKEQSSVRVHQITDGGPFFGNIYLGRLTAADQIRNRGAIQGVGIKNHGSFLPIAWSPIPFRTVIAVCEGEYRDGTSIQEGWKKIRVEGKEIDFYGIPIKDQPDSFEKMVQLFEKIGSVEKTDRDRDEKEGWVRLVERINRALEKGNIFIHCKKGVSRSPAFLALLLMSVFRFYFKEKAPSLRRIENYIRLNRPQANLSNFIEKLERQEIEKKKRD